MPITVKSSKQTSTEQPKLLRFSIAPHLQKQEIFPCTGIFDNSILDFWRRTQLFICPEKFFHLLSGHINDFGFLRIICRLLPYQHLTSIALVIHSMSLSKS